MIVPRFGIFILLVTAVLIADGSAQSSVQTEIPIDAVLLVVNRIDLNEIGAPTADFAKNVPEGAAHSLAGSPQSTILQSLHLSAMNGKASQVRISSRIPRTSQDDQSYLDVTVELELTCRSSLNPESALTVMGRIQIRRRENSSDGPAQIIFSTHLLRQVIGVGEGEAVVVGGFIDDIEAKTLEGIPMLKASPILKYLFERKFGPDALVVLLTPHIVHDSGPVVSTNPAVPEVSQAPSKETARPLYTVQVGAFKSEPNARALQSELARRYPDVFVETFAGDQTIYRVRVGHVGNFRAAQQLEKELSSAGFNAVVWPLN